MVPLNIKTLFQYLKKKVYPEGFIKQDKTTLRKFAQKVRVSLKIRVLVLRGQGEGWHSASTTCYHRGKKARVFEECHSVDTPAAIILFEKSKSGFTGLTTTRTRWKWLVTNFTYLAMHPLDRGF